MQQPRTGVRGSSDMAILSSLLNRWDSLQGRGHKVNTSNCISDLDCNQHSHKVQFFKCIVCLHVTPTLNRNFYDILMLNQVLIRRYGHVECCGLLNKLQQPTSLCVCRLSLSPYYNSLSWHLYQTLCLPMGHLNKHSRIYDCVYCHPTVSTVGSRKYTHGR